MFSPLRQVGKEKMSPSSVETSHPNRIGRNTEAILFVFLRPGWARSHWWVGTQKVWLCARLHTPIDNIRRHIDTWPDELADNPWRGIGVVLVPGWARSISVWMKLRSWFIGKAILLSVPPCLVSLWEMSSFWRPSPSGIAGGGGVTTHLWDEWPLWEEKPLHPLALLLVVDDLWCLVLGITEAAGNRVTERMEGDTGCGQRSVLAGRWQVWLLWLSAHALAISWGVPP